MKKWFISDTHFFHNNIIRYTGRPFETVDKMNCCLIKNWNDCIGEYVGCMEPKVVLKQQQALAYAK